MVVVSEPKIKLYGQLINDNADKYFKIIVLKCIEDSMAIQKELNNLPNVVEIETTNPATFTKTLNDIIFEISIDNLLERFGSISLSFSKPSEIDYIARVL